jgi:hypothetical protein
MAQQGESSHRRERIMAIDHKPDETTAARPVLPEPDERNGAGALNGCAPPAEPTPTEPDAADKWAPMREWLATPEMQALLRDPNWVDPTDEELGFETKMPADWEPSAEAREWGASLRQRLLEMAEARKRSD